MTSLPSRIALLLLIAGLLGCQPEPTVPSAAPSPPANPEPAVTIPTVEIIERFPSAKPKQTVEEKKLSFISVLLPIVEYENLIIEQQRKRLLEIDSSSITNDQRSVLALLATQYRVSLELPPKEQLQLLLQRVDQIPVNLAITQGAIESAWGKSRFAREGNNLFGHWCYKPGCGLVPNRRTAGKTHEVKRFASINASVHAYMLNLNTHSAYKSLRVRRAALRAANQPLSASALAHGLTRYSERGQDYVNSVLSIIKSNRPLIEQVRNEML